MINESILRMLSEAVKEREQGIYNYCVNGECIGCGECCSNLLPMTDKEVKRIRHLVRKRQLKPINHIPAPLMNAIDTVCPFMDDKLGDKKCTIYSHRPWICRDFKCDKYGRDFSIDPNFVAHAEEYQVRNVRETFWDEKGNAK